MYNHNTGTPATTERPTIFAFVAGPAFGDPTSGDVHVTALREDGEFLASHISSSVAWAKHDIGVDSDWKHEQYAAACPGGWHLVWVDDADNDERVKAAYAKHVAKYGPGAAEVEAAS